MLSPHLPLSPATLLTQNRRACTQGDVLIGELTLDFVILTLLCHALQKLQSNVVVH